MTYEEYREKSKLRTWKFNIVIDTPFRNIEYIHPLKQEQVYQIVKCAEKNPIVKKVIIFGSAITNRCDFQSDLDICMDWNVDCVDEEGVFVPDVARVMNQISRITHGECDIVHRQYLKGTLVERDALNGVVVYG